MNSDDANNTANLIGSLGELAGRVAFWIVLIGVFFFFAIRALRRSNARRAAPSDWHIEAGGTPKWRFNAPQGWPPAPPGFVPPADWKPDPSWPAAPAEWQWWVAD